MKKYFSTVLCLLLVTGMYSCGGGSASLTSIAVTPADPSISVGATQQFTATGTYSDNSTADLTATVTWSSSDETKATIVSSGLATAVAVGTVTLTATSGSISGSTTLTMTAMTTIDVHAHATVTTAGASAQDLVDIMTANNISRVIIMEPPRPVYQEPDEATVTDIAFFSDQSSTFLYMYGGSEIQPLLYAVGQTANITSGGSTGVYPNGPAGAISEADVAKLNDIRLNPSNYLTEFQNRAITAAQTGLYVGFGELAPYHVSLRSGHPYMRYAANSAWMLLLSDIAAQYNMVMDVHCEETDATLAELSALLSYNTNTKIIWDHAGWSNTGGATAAVFTQMLADYPNLYLSLKMRTYSDTLAAGSPTDSNGNLKSEWSTLLTTYADRIMAGTDCKYWTSSGEPIEDEFDGGYTLLNNMLEQLPDTTAYKIRSGTAKTLFGITQ